MEKKTVASRNRYLRPHGIHKKNTSKAQPKKGICRRQPGNLHGFHWVLCLHPHRLLVGHSNDWRVTSAIQMIQFSLLNHHPQYLPSFCCTLSLPSHLTTLPHQQDATGQLAVCFLLCGAVTAATCSAVIRAENVLRIEDRQVGDGRCWRNASGYY